LHFSDDHLPLATYTRDMPFRHCRPTLPPTVSTGMHINEAGAEEQAPVPWCASSGGPQDRTAASSCYWHQQPGWQAEKEVHTATASEWGDADVTKTSSIFWGGRWRQASLGGGMGEEFLKQRLQFLLWHTVATA
jgi:hypothetical protein